jgi:hypothetical protein
VHLPRPKRLTGLRCLELLQQLDEESSADDRTSDESDSEPPAHGNESAVESETTDSQVSDDAIADEQRTLVSANLDATSVEAAKTRGRGRGRGRGGRGRGIGLSTSLVSQSASKSEYGRDGTVWDEIPIGVENVGRRQQHNVVKEKAGLTSYASHRIKEGSALSAFRLIIDEPMIRHIRTCTEAEARRQLNDDAWSVTADELDAFIAILYARGATGAKGLELKSLWNAQWGVPFCRQTMTRDRFIEIMKFLRFDVKSTRSARLQSDKFALASEPWNRFITNSQMCYTAGENLTIDEQLFPTKTRCRFTQYMANKPDKFGIKFWLLVDVDAKYLLNGFPYLGKDDVRPPGQSLSEIVVLRLVEPYLQKGRNVTTDNFFTSLKLAKQLKERKTSIVGTMNKQRRELPPPVGDTSGTLYSSTLWQHDDVTLTVYRCKRSKNVTIMSSMHTSVEIDSGEKKIPETVKFYNNTKYGVDVIDQMARKYSVKSGSRRWPVQVFYNVLDLAAINSWLLYRKATGVTISRRNYILQLAEELREPHMKQRKTEQLSSSAVSEDLQRKRRQCQVGRCKGNKTFDICNQCQRAVCGQCTASREVHKLMFCSDCNNPN